MERRGHQRFEGRIRGSLLINESRHLQVRISDLSASGLAVECEENVDIGDTVVAHLDGGARLEGRVVRQLENGFAIKLAITQTKQQRLAETLQNAAEQDGQVNRLNLNRRLANRVTGGQRRMTAQTENGTVEGRVIDVSLTGLAFETQAELALESWIEIGRMRGVVVRRDENIYGVQFAGGIAKGVMDEPALMLSALARKTA
ncbi:MAG: PilZ domain-containing protein [Pseudomonadota bacterium]